MEYSRNLIIFKLLTMHSDNTTLGDFVKTVSSFFNIDYGELLEWSTNQENIIKGIKQIDADPVIQAVKKLKLGTILENVENVENVVNVVENVENVDPALINDPVVKVLKNNPVAKEKVKAEKKKVEKVEKVEKVAVEKVAKVKPRRKPESLDTKYKKLILSDMNNLPLLHKIEEKSVLRDIYDKCNNILIKKKILNICNDDNIILSKALKDERLKILAIKVIHQRMKKEWEIEELERIEKTTTTTNSSSSSSSTYYSGEFNCGYEPPIDQ